MQGFKTDVRDVRDRNRETIRDQWKRQTAFWMERGLHETLGIPAGTFPSRIPEPDPKSVEGGCERGVLPALLVVPAPLGALCERLGVAVANGHSVDAIRYSSGQNPYWVYRAELWGRREGTRRPLTILEAIFLTHILALPQECKGVVSGSPWGGNVAGIRLNGTKTLVAASLGGIGNGWLLAAQPRW